MVLDDVSASHGLPATVERLAVGGRNEDVLDAPVCPAVAGVAIRARLGRRACRARRRFELVKEDGQATQSPD